MLNFGELKSNTAVILQRSLDTDYIIKIGVWINLAQDHLFNIYDYWSSLQDEYAFSSVLGTEGYYMPSHFDKPLAIFDLTNNKDLNVKAETTYVSESIGSISSSSTGVPEVARIYGESPVTTQISTAGDTVKVKSSNSQDTLIIVRVEGFVDSALTIVGYENITLNGTSFVAGSTTFYKLLHIAKSADTIGFVTIANSANTTIGFIAQNDREARHKVLKLGLIPAGAYSYRVYFKRKYRKMVSDYDYPFAEADDYLVQRATGYGLAQEKETYDKAQFWIKEADKSLAALLTNQQGKYGPKFQQRMIYSTYRANRA